MGHMIAATRPRTILTVVAVSAAAFAGPAVAAEGAGDGPTTTVAPPAPTSSVPAPSTSTTSPGVPSTGPAAPTTSIHVPPLPPELTDDPRLPYLIDPGPGDGIDLPLAQRAFDPGSSRVLPAKVAEARRKLDTAQATLRALQDRAGSLEAAVSELSGRVDLLRGDVRDAVNRAAAARRKLSAHAVTAYMVGPVEHRLALLSTADFLDMGVARSYVEVVGATRERLAREYEQARKGLSSKHARLAADLGERESELAIAQADIPAAFLYVLDAYQELAAYEAGAHAYIAGFTFPVAGEVEFIDSWGFPRMMGTPSAHWHQGTDVFATSGTPLLAAENGYLTRIGSASLGGNKLWLVGESGHEYYYAHLSGFAPGVAEGRKVTAGEIVGYVGDTGNAKGTSPHLHFEIHPDGTGPVNPYPLLKAAYGSRPVMPAVAPVPVPAAIPSLPSG
jgi:murein DD-endopeptidase MepM/ murein hydrolase activator NlpD